MLKILFLRSKNAFLPEIDAYINYFNQSDEFIAYDSSKIDERYNIDEFDIIWEFKGLGGVKTNKQLLIHDYASLSTGNLPKIKNKLKKIMNYKPDIRIFLNEDVCRGFNFKDNIEYVFRDMGVSEDFIKVQNTSKEYDFVYTGCISKNRGMDKVLNVINRNSIGKVCLIGNVDDDIYNEYKHNKDFIFTGKVEYTDVPKIASKAIHGLNFIPDKYPYNLQTSTKLLEYMALGLNIVTTDYKWVREFEKQHRCNFYKIYSENIDIRDIKKFDFITNFNHEDFMWDNIIEKSNIKQKILSHIK